MAFGPLTGCPPSHYGSGIDVTPGNDQVVYSTAQSGDETQEDGDVISVVLGIELANQATDLPAEDASISPLALVRWGRGSVEFTAEIDWLQGTTFTVVASSVRITGRYPIVVDAFQPPIRLNAAACYGDVPRYRFGPRRTFHITVAAAAASGRIRIPNFASSIRVLGLSVGLAAGSYIITYLAADGATTLAQDVALPGQDSAIFAGAYFITIRNNAVADSPIAVIFGLIL